MSCHVTNPKKALPQNKTKIQTIIDNKVQGHTVYGDPFSSVAACRNKKKLTTAEVLPMVLISLRRATLPAVDYQEIDLGYAGVSIRRYP